MEPIQDIRQEVHEIRKLDYFKEPPKADTSHFNQLQEKTDELKVISKKYIENPRNVLKELETMNNLLNRQQRSLYMQKKFLRERQNVVQTQLQSANYKNYIAEYI